MSISAFTRHLWPLSAHLSRGQLCLRGQNLVELAKMLGTPLYIYDGATLDHAIAAYRHGLRAWPGPSRLSYAAKAWLTLPLAQVLQSRKAGLDVVSEGELGIALAAGSPGGCIHLHGSNKSPDLLRQAIDAGVGAIVIDHPQELDLLIGRIADLSHSLDLWLRLNPDLLAPTHSFRQTGHAAAKFGMSRDQASIAAERIRRHPRLKLAGLHTHIGSQLFELDAIFSAIERLIHLAAELHAAGHAPLRYLCPGGGLGVPYHPADPAIPLAQTVERIAHHCAETWAQYNGGAEHPVLVLEPGRSLIARAAIALYTVGNIRHLADGSRIIAVDGGMADNLRPALYGARYTACLPRAPLASALGPARIVGPLCESGDFLIDAVDLPDVHPSDILALPVAGAYQLSMSSNYNATLTPPAYWLDQDRLLLFQRRQTLSDLLACHLPLPPLP